MPHTTMLSTPTGMTGRRLQAALFLGLTAVFTGYLSVWLSGPAAGLSLLGVEMGEWLKFLGVGVNRNLFYWPPVILGILMMLLSATWPNGRWQTWALRGVAAAVSLLAFPAWEDLMGPARAEYTPRLWMIGVVLLAGLAAAFFSQRRLLARRLYGSLPWLLMAVAGVLGLALPLWLFFEIRPFLENLVGSPMRAGVGLWLHAAGCLLVILSSVWSMRHATELGHAAE